MDKTTLQKQLNLQNLRKTAQETKLANINAEAAVNAFNMQSELDKTLVLIADIEAKIAALQ